MLAETGPATLWVANHYEIGSRITTMSKAPPCARVLHITDPHLFADQSATLRGVATYASLERVLAHYGEAAWQADIVTLTGDLTQDESRDAYRHVRTLLAPLALPVLCVPGNHDVRAVMRSVLSALPFHYCASIRLGNWLIIGMDSCVDDSAHGSVDAAELLRAQAEIDESEADHVLVCVHHPPVAVGSRWLDGVGMKNREKFLQTMADAGRVRGVLFGHVHQAVDTRVRGIEIIGTPSTCRQFKPGSEKFAVDDNPPAYRRVELHADGRLESTLESVQHGAT